MIVSFPPPAKALTLNQRLHWAAKAKLTRAWREAAGFTATALGFGPRRGRVVHLPRSIVVLDLPVRSINVRRDPHNWFPTVKAVVDGLVDAGLWPDDTSEYVITTEPRFHAAKDDQLVSVLIRPAAQEGVL